MGVQWYPRMGDIPGLGYEPPEAVDRSRLVGHDAVPEVSRREFDGRVRESLWWQFIADGEGLSTSASPASSAQRSELGTRATPEMCTRLWECLELPGTARDYHFAIQSVAGELSRRTWREPEAIEWFEFISWLDLRLIQVCPEAVRDEFAAGNPDRGEYYRVSAFHGLIDLYSREGLLQEARGVAELAERFGQGESAVAELDGRLLVLRAEDAG